MSLYSIKEKNAYVPYSCGGRDGKRRVPKDVYTNNKRKMRRTPNHGKRNRKKK